jgi:hypothetical protein
MPQPFSALTMLRAADRRHTARCAVRRLAYHLDLAPHGYVEDHVPGWYRWFPTRYALSGWLVEAEALVMQPTP